MKLVGSADKALTALANGVMPDLVDVMALNGELERLRSTRRDHFAAAAMTGMIARGAGPGDYVAQCAVAYADDLIAVLDKDGGS